MSQKKKLGPLDIYDFLPKTNCGKCTQKVCMAFAVQISERNVLLEECPPLFEESKYSEMQARLKEILAPPIKEITIGSGDSKVKIGGEMFLRRHELRYFNPTAISIVVNDEMSEDKILKQIKQTNDFSYKYIGMILKLDSIAIRSKSNDPIKFENTVNKVAENTTLPLILWSFDPVVLENGLNIIKERRPLIYAATKENWQDMAELALKYNCPLTIYSPNDIKTAKSIANVLKQWNVKDLAIDVGCDFQEGVKDTINNLTMMRISAIGEDEDLGYPLVGAPVTLWDKKYENLHPEAIRWMESCLSSMMIVRYADLLMVSDAEMWATLPLVILRNNIYNDPRKPVSVDPGLRTFNNPSESPVFMTGNFALSYYTVMNDIEKIDCYLLVVDTEGTSVESSVAGRKLTAEKIAETIKSSNIEEKVKHRTLIIPGLAARLKGDIEDATKWDVVVGPKDSSGIPGFLKESWDGKDHTPGWSYK